MKMRKGLLFLPFLLLLVGAFISCEEVEEAGKYDNWRERNEAFADSIKRLTGENYVATAEQADAMELGKLYAIQTTASTTVSAFYYGTLIVGDQFDGNFDGYSALDTNIPLSSLKEPTAFDSPTTFAVASVIPGWTAALQLMRAGERWMLYIPWQSAYGSSGNNDGTIPGYTALTFDLLLERIVE